MLQGYYGPPGYQGPPGYKGEKVIYILAWNTMLNIYFKYPILGKMLQICTIWNKGIVYANIILMMHI